MINNVVLMGRLVATPELRNTQTGVAVTSFTIAVERSFARAGEQRQADFIDCVAWRNTAEFISKYFRKGQMMVVQGSIQTRMYQDKDGNKRKAFEIVADNVNFADSKRSDSPAPSYTGSYSSQIESVSIYSSGTNDDFEELPMDDDLPF